MGIYLLRTPNNHIRTEATVNLLEVEQLNLYDGWMLLLWLILHKTYKTYEVAVERDTLCLHL